ncbi:hypothetical protein BDR07DRAFT_1465329 [Suillus spraguei]|nr:hypothetical protein BDR07DRAFT_1465329 [Suillus spraguei]
MARAARAAPPPAPTTPPPVAAATTFKAQIRHLFTRSPHRATLPVIDVPFAKGKERNAAADEDRSKDPNIIPDDGYFDTTQLDSNTQQQQQPVSVQVDTGEHGGGRAIRSCCVNERIFKGGRGDNSASGTTPSGGDSFDAEARRREEEAQLKAKTENECTRAEVGQRQLGELVCKWKEKGSVTSVASYAFGHGVYYGEACVGQCLFTRDRRPLNEQVIESKAILLSTGNWQALFLNIVQIQPDIGDLIVLGNETSRSSADISDPYQRYVILKRRHNAAFAWET